MSKLRRDRIVFVSEILGLGKQYGLTKERVLRIIEQAELSGVGFRAETFVYAMKS